MAGKRAVSDLQFRSPRFIDNNDLTESVEGDNLDYVDLDTNVISATNAMCSPFLRLHAEIRNSIDELVLCE